MDDEAMFAVFERLGGDRTRKQQRGSSGAIRAPRPRRLRTALHSPVQPPRRRGHGRDDGHAGASRSSTCRCSTHFATNIHPTFDFSAGLSRITCPTLVLGGDDDPVCPLAGTKEIAVRDRRQRPPGDLRRRARHAHRAEGPVLRATRGVRRWLSRRPPRRARRESDRASTARGSRRRASRPRSARAPAPVRRGRDR